VTDQRKDEQNPIRRGRRPLKLGNFVYPQYDYRPLADDEAQAVKRRPVVVVGAGMVGLTTAIDLARKGVRCVLIDDNDTVSAGSRSIAQARRTMEIWSRLGCAEPMREKGISWSRGHTHHRDDTVLSFTVFPEGGSRFPSFTSLAQYYVEHFLVERARTLDHLDIRWLNRLSGVRLNPDGVELTVETPDGTYRMQADWLVAADGAKSRVRSALGLAFEGDRLQDKFVIADVRCGADFPFERNYWFEPPFYDGNSVLRVPQSDSIWRIDWQIDPTADTDSELAPDLVRQRLERMLGEDTDFEIEWVSTYTSEHRLMDSFRHGRVFFAGDAAHQFSPFGGGRGGNSGIQDADNLAWKLAAVIQGRAAERLLDSYDAERRPIAERNLADSKKSTEFITPKSDHSWGFHDAVMNLAKVAPFAKSYVNTGRFAVWPVLENSPLSLPDSEGFADLARPGTPVLDCPLLSADGQPAWLADQIGDDFTVVTYGPTPAGGAALLSALSAAFPTRSISIGAAGASDEGHDFRDVDGAFARLYGAEPGTTYLFRPDQHVLARWRQFDSARIAVAVRRTLGLIGIGLNGIGLEQEKAR
jgi:3-(3-hydroxy-phenyl)propionate hydroxylase